MSSYATYCQDQSIDCARRARLARSLEVATYWRCPGSRLAQACSTGTLDWGCLGPGERRGRHIQPSFFRQRETTQAKANAGAQTL
jgi:hypothetical protein